MKLFSIGFLGLILITITGCEQQDVSDETATELQTVDKDRFQSPQSRWDD